MSKVVIHQIDKEMAHSLCVRAIDFHSHYKSLTHMLRAKDESLDGNAPWMRAVLWLAGAYNLAWGAFVVLFPLVPFERAGMDPPRYPEIWQCVGMIVGVYGVGYIIAAFDPIRHWPIVLVGLLGKVLGPLGMLHAVWKNSLPPIAGLVCLTNDLIWWVPFALILWKAFRAGRNVTSDASGRVDGRE